MGFESLNRHDSEPGMVADAGSPKCQHAIRVCVGEHTKGASPAINEI